MLELLTPSQMAEADRRAIAAGAPGYALMKTAGEAVAHAAETLFAGAGQVLVLAGTGNNGGDGFVAAAALNDTWREAKVALLGDPSAIQGDAGLAMADWRGETLAFNPALLAQADLVVDALFGAGLSRDVDGPAAAAIEAVNASGKPVLAVDLPSGVDGETGAIRGTAIRAAATVTFFRKKPGHLLMPGRALCGQVQLADIGVPAGVLAGLGATAFENAPALWAPAYPVPRLDGHKYDRGHAIVVSGPAHATGAARLAAGAALRAGAGLVTLASPADAMDVNAGHLTAVMLAQSDGPAGLKALLKDERFKALALGPALGVGGATRALVLAALGSKRACVIDADAITSFAGARPALHEAIAKAPAAVLTPHSGEFARLFGETSADKLTATRAAAATSGAVVAHKGSDTVIAAPDGRAAINANAPPWLATAGAGDVLAGVVCGLLAQGMPAFEAACAAVWLHGRAAQLVGPGLIAEDLDAGLRGAVQELVSPA